MFYVISSIVVLVLLVALIIGLIVMVNRLLDRVSTLSYLLQQNSRKVQFLDSHSIKLTNALKEQHEVLTSLTTSVGQTLKQYAAEMNRQIMPTPQLAEMMNQTIQEQIAIEVSLSKHKLAPDSGYVEKIIANVKATYPHIKEEYIVKKCMAAIEVALSK